MKYTVYFFAMFFLFLGTSDSQQITMKRNNYVTELNIKINPDFIYSYYIEGRNANVIFKNKIRVNIADIPENPFIAEINSTVNSVIITVKENIDVFMDKESDGLKIILAKNKRFDELLLKSQINPPKMISTDINNVNEAAENELIKIDEAINKKQYDEAVNLINAFLKTNSEGFYAIEAYYKLGEVYLKLGEKSEIYYKRASEIFDNFTTQYPFYFRYDDALEKAAIASYNAHDYEKALRFYKLVFDRNPSSNKGKKALMKMGEIYANIGQNDRAIRVYLDYIKKFGESQKINNKIGYLYAKMGDFNTAYGYFYDFIKNKQYDFENPDVLFEMAKVLENKKLYELANEIYSFIFEKHKNSVYAGEALYRSAEIYERLGNKNTASKLLLDCKSNYADKYFGQVCALKYAGTHIKLHDGDYWKNFLQSVLNADNNDLRANALYLLLKAYYNEGNIEEAFDTVKSIETNYLTSSVMDDVAKIKQDILYAMAKRKFENGNFEDAKNIIDALLSEFPSTHYRKDTEIIISKINNIEEEEIRKKFLSSLDNSILNIKDYSDYINFLNNLRTMSINDNYTQVPIENYIKKVYPDFINYLYNKGDLEGFIIATLDYMSLVGEESVDPNILNNFSKTIEYNMMEDIDKKEYVSAIREYERIRPIGISNKFLETIDELISYALFKVGEKERAKEFLLKKKNPINTKYGEVMNIIINKKIPLDGINKYSPDLVKFIINDLKSTDSVLAYSFASAYKNDDNLTLTSQYDIIEGTSDENVRENLVIDFYLTLKGKDQRDKKLFADIFYQAGLIYYDDGNYEKVVESLSEYEAAGLDKDNLAQAYYLMGKSYVNLNRIDLARQYFAKIINNFPGSPLTNIAKQELEKISS